MVRKLLSIFSHSFEGKVWNIVADRQGERLLIETRKGSEFSTAFHIYDRASNSLMIKNLSFEEKWWIGISFFDGKLAVFHVFQGTDNPDQKEFFAYDLYEKKILWDKADINIVDFREHSFVAYAGENGEAQPYDLMTGSRLTSPVTGETVPGENVFLKYPLHYAQGTDHFNTVARFLSKLGFVELQRGIDYFEGHGVVIMAFYRGGTELVNELVVMDMEQDIVLQECLGTGLKGISDRAFFIYHNTLIFVKDNTDFFTFQLPQ